MTITVADVYRVAKKVFGTCDDEILFEHITDAVEILANTGDFDPMIGYLDICVQDDRCVTLPREVDTIIAINLGGRPALLRDQLFSFHLNGPGDCKRMCDYSVQDRNLVPVLQPLQAPSKLVAFVEREEDAGSELWAYGYDVGGKWIRTFDKGGYVDGYRVPTIDGVAVPDTDAPEFARVVRVRKAETVGAVRLSSFDNSATTGALLGVYEAEETEPLYRRIQLSVCADWVRIAFRRRLLKIRRQTDVIPLPSRAAVKFMLQALKYYDQADLARGTAFEATARRLVTEGQWSHSVPTSSPPVVNDAASINSHEDDWVE